MLMNIVSGFFFASHGFLMPIRQSKKELYDASFLLSFSATGTSEFAGILAFPNSGTR
jgi:hypothetical protein